MNTKAFPLYELASYRLQGCLSVDWSDGLTNAAVALDGEGQAVGTIITETVSDQGQLFGLYTCCRP